MSYYTVNVARRVDNNRYEHFFATAEHSCVSERQATEVLNALRAAFAEPEFKVECTYWQCVGSTFIPAQSCQCGSAVHGDLRVIKGAHHGADCPLHTKRVARKAGRTHKTSTL